MSLISIINRQSSSHRYHSDRRYWKFQSGKTINRPGKENSRVWNDKIQLNRTQTLAWGHLLWEAAWRKRKFQSEGDFPRSPDSGGSAERMRDRDLCDGGTLHQEYGWRWPDDTLWLRWWRVGSGLNWCMSHLTARWQQRESAFNFDSYSWLGMKDHRKPCVSSGHVRGKSCWVNFASLNWN